jgi:hypothetical protein
MYLASLATLLAVALIAVVGRSRTPGAALVARIGTILAAIAAGLLVADYGIQPSSRLASCVLVNSVGTRRGRCRVSGPDFAALARELLLQWQLSLRGLAREIPVNAGQLSRILSRERPVSEEIAGRCDEIFGTGCRLAEAAQRDIVAALGEICDRFDVVCDCVDTAFVPDGLLDDLPRPAQVGAARVAGVNLDSARVRAVLAAVVALALLSGGFTVADLTGRAVAQATGESLVAVLGTGAFHACVYGHSDGLTVDVLAARQPEPHPWPEAVIRVHFPNAAAIGLRDHDDVVTVHDSRGRIVAVDTAAGRIVANLTLRE